ncbi:sigma-54-dependent Fis family transcriptional regulator [Nonlabens spongiae]|uniref:Sigma-54-dependent Fis family transcriptional regulator n=1 Tax=Nonlabens spongiae TaxID=331648 RepID=A0A1W6MPH1_9FLAO|nr:sigma-54 dependent transcriptional regulator [Nonlabens spongiae]ARN79508.1 sigma-54-dependent Fis family transcriptional regulator [Nonlabens spongiae]
MLLKSANILVVDDDEDVLTALRLLLKSRTAKVVTSKNPNTIDQLMRETSFDIVILDMNFNAMVNTGNEGVYWLNHIRKKKKDLDIVLITAYADIDLAIKSLKMGASDFMVKPWSNNKMIETLGELLDKRENKNKQPENVSDQIVGSSEIMQDVFVKLRKVAPTDANVLILGENGTGKELVAQAIHNNSLRKDKPFVKVDVGALTESLFESELFGYKKGAFTDAREDRQGRFEAAHGGTLFLDEIGNITLRQQARLLSVLQNRAVIPLGSNTPVAVDIRLICATNLSLMELSDESRFRKDLIYRINTLDIVVPPLRQRGDDILELARYFTDQYASKYTKGDLSFSADFERKLQKHSFPGNVRELQYAMEKAVIMGEGNILTAADLSFSNIEVASPAQKQEHVSTNLEDVEKQTIVHVIDKNNGNITKSAKELGLTRTALYRRLQKYDL